MKKSSLFIILLFSWMTQGMIPTVEGIFRNASHVNTRGDLVVLKFKVAEFESLEDPSIVSTKYYKFLISENPKTSSIQALVVEYSGRSMKYSQITGKFFFRNLKRSIRQDENVKRQFFLSILVLSTINNSAIIGEFLKKQGDGFFFNREIINGEKRNLLKKYRSYLGKIKKNKELKGILLSPLEPEDEEEKLLVKKILKEPFYKSSSRIFLIKENQTFVWKVELGSISAIFSNEEHRLKKISLDNPPLLFEILLSDYGTFQQGHIFPKKILLKSSSKNLVEVKALSMGSIGRDQKTMRTRSREYDKHILKHAPKITKRSDLFPFLL